MTIEMAISLIIMLGLISTAIYVEFDNIKKGRR